MRPIEESELPRVMIATPTPGSVKTRYMRTVIGTIRDLEARGIRTEYAAAEGTEIPVMRNELATMFLKSDFTHCLWIDSDMGFQSDTAFRLLSAHKAMACVPYPAKMINAQKLEHGLRRGLPFDQALQLAENWYCGPTGVVNHNLAQMRWIGFGCVLMERQVLCTMIDRGVATKQATPETRRGGERYNFFGPRAADISSATYVTEDVSFCRRWTEECGGEIWALTDVIVWHVGDFSYMGRYADIMSATSHGFVP